MLKVYAKLRQLMRQLKDIDLHSAAFYHSEKLALCFGLLNLPVTKPISIQKPPSLLSSNYETCIQNNGEKNSSETTFGFITLRKVCVHVEITGDFS
ncbi:LOW QUALITY PROTEIN: hypothetical protein RJ641_032848 [Dillenia turbinata]|uniref:Uncharacterized protein n=1 Tax=Dillenia turbinata TaxID=194707 RepID=A0AAN8VX67_9MAGN